MHRKTTVVIVLFVYVIAFFVQYTIAVAQKLDYLPFGSERVNIKTGSFDAHFTFTDQEKDAESGLLYYGARYYHPGIGRFLQVDPVVRDNVGRKEFSLALANPQLLNAYSYVGNNPLKYTDENGEFLPILAFYAIATADVWVPAVIVGVGAIGGFIASWHLGGALGYYSEGDYASGDGSLDTSIFASTTTGEVAGGLVAVGEAMVAGYSGNKNNDIQPLKSIPSEGKIDPNKIRFIQDDIGSKIHGPDNKLYPLKDLVNGLKEGTIKPDDIPPVKIFEQNGKIWSLDNRRVKAFREADLGIQYQKATPQEVAKSAWKFTTKNDGVDVKIRGSK